MQTCIHLTDIFISFHKIPSTQILIISLSSPVEVHAYFGLKNNFFWFLIADLVDKIHFALNNLKCFRNFNNQDDHIIYCAIQNTHERGTIIWLGQQG